MFEEEIKKLAERLGLKESQVAEVYDTYWYFIKETIRSFDATKDGTPKSKYSSVIVKRLGTFYDKRTTYKRMHEELTERIKKKYDAKTKKD